MVESMWCPEATWWDSEKRESPFSTVPDPEDEWCEMCGDDRTCADCQEGN